jgi:hypothetical protein
MKINFDVDIDMANRDDFLKLINHTPAVIEKDGVFTKHNTGVYFQDIPLFPMEGYSSIDHKKAEEDEWFKVDFLNNSVYQDVKNERQLDTLLNTEPEWTLLKHKEIVEQLYHINNHFDIIDQYKPKSIEELAMVLAVIRPGKRHLLGKSFDEMRSEIWIATDSYYFKKSHSIAFATVITLQMALLTEQSKVPFVLAGIPAS